MKKIILICLVVAAQQLQAQVLEIYPKYPQVGKEVTLTYRPSASNAAQVKEAKTVRLIFTSSTFYNLPWELLMTWQGNAWQTSFTVPAYATFASFYFQSGKLKDRPTADADFTLAVYKGKKRVKDSYFHESYGIKSQNPNAPDLLQKQIILLQKELALYPNNFEAQVRLKSIEMAAATPAQAAGLKREAISTIHQQFEKDPENPVNLSRISMAFNMIGEGYRTDSLKRVVIKRYPASDLGRLYLSALIAKHDDSVKMILRLDSLLAHVHAKGESAIAIHKILFKNALSKGDAHKAIEHAQKSLGKTTPYTARDLRDIALAFTSYKIAPETAFAYAEKSLAMIQHWPVGNIRNLPDFGYVLPYVDDSVHNLTVQEAKAGLLSLMALNKVYMGDKTAALDYTIKSISFFENREVLLNAAFVFEANADYKNAYAKSWKLVVDNPFDDVASVIAQRNFIKFNADGSAYVKELQLLKDAKNNNLVSRLEKQLLNLPRPELNGITDLSGKVMNMDSLKGKIVIMDFWATWCIPCMKEMPFLQKVYDKYKNNPNVVFMVINSGAGNTIDDARGWMKKNSNYTFPLYFNTDKDLGKKVGFSLIPTVALLDQTGKMQFRTVGFEGAEMEAKLSQQIEVLLKRK
ncbi:TlpA family protein disulfide reductase [Pedobacter sp. MC2016-14]|uniref:TlpA family protein disulfide reductase n=1 Tax=Pedobacter sp. MC2016-14 TaxID=2897327 RepID=UPI001E298A60|nr:TlpA disulfide reductase family protein [Pedobacter sp. MC2016-14]MCD0487602.1 TlpA family protein disulfide reductase [Pedobacter sp. MC2016-14]